MPVFSLTFFFFWSGEHRLGNSAQGGVFVVFNAPVVLLSIGVGEAG